MTVSGRAARSARGSPENAASATSAAQTVPAPPTWRPCRISCVHPAPSWRVRSVAGGVAGSGCRRRAEVRRGPVLACFVPIKSTRGRPAPGTAGRPQLGPKLPLDAEPRPAPRKTVKEGVGDFLMATGTVKWSSAGDGRSPHRSVARSSSLCTCRSALLSPPWRESDGPPRIRSASCSS